jgi:GNAT superfamily N-acetyltransferase
MIRPMPDPHYIIRLATVSDIAHLPVVEEAAAGLFATIGMAAVAESPVTDPDVLRAAQSDGRLWVAAGDADRPVGFALVMLHGGQPHLNELSVDPAHGRRGLGRRLVETVCAWTAARGHDRLTLSTFRDVPWNGPFYGRLGFTALADADLDPVLAALRRAEAERGLPIARRAIMAWVPDEIT